MASYSFSHPAKVKSYISSYATSKSKLCVHPANIGFFAGSMFLQFQPSACHPKKKSALSSSHHQIPPASHWARHPSPHSPLLPVQDVPAPLDHLLDRFGYVPFANVKAAGEFVQRFERLGGLLNGPVIRVLAFVVENWQEKPVTPLLGFCQLCNFFLQTQRAIRE